MAWAVAAASVALVAWALPVAVHDGLTGRMFLQEDLGFSMVLVATMPILGAFVVTRHRGNRLGWLFCLHGPLRGVEILADVWVRHDYGSTAGSWPGGPVATWLLFAGPFFLLPTTALLALWFPDGRAPPGRWRRVELAPVVLVVLLVGILTLSWPYRGPQLLADPPSFHGWRAAATQGCVIASIMIVLVGFLAGFASLFSRLRHAEPAVRAQVKWFLFGFAAAFVLDIAGDFGSAVAPLRLAAVIVLELCIIVAIERYRLWEIDRLINRTVVYGTLTVLAAAVYASATITIAVTIGGTTTRSPLAVAAATLMIAVLFAPTRKRVQQAVDRRFDRRAFDAVTRVRAFADRLGTETPDPAEVRLLLAGVLRDPDLLLFFPTTGGTLIDHTGAQTSAPPDNADRAVTTIGPPGKPVGVIGHRRSLGDEGQLLIDVLHTARPSIEHARLQAELRVQLVAVEESRMRLLEATDTERRRIERDLHDGAQQRLVALALRIRTEQHRGSVEVGTDTDRLLSGMVDELQSAVADLRSMTHGMLPAVLTSGGTAPALRDLVGRYDGNVELLGVPDHRHSPMIEATAWFVASEGLTNASKHATGSKVTLSARCHAGSLEVIISDTGAGGATLTGTGLGGLADRVDACGGHFTLTSPAGGGTELIATLPCE